MLFEDNPCHDTVRKRIQQRFTGLGHMAAVTRQLPTFYCAPDKSQPLCALKLRQAAGDIIACLSQQVCL